MVLIKTPIFLADELKIELNACVSQVKDFRESTKDNVANGDAAKLLLTLADVREKFKLTSNDEIESVIKSAFSSISKPVNKSSIPFLKPPAKLITNFLNSIQNSALPVLKSLSKSAIFFLKLLI